MADLGKKAVERAFKLHRDAVVVDGHSDTVFKMLKEKRWLGERSDRGHMDIPRMYDGGVDVQIFAVFTLNREEPFLDAMRLIDVFLGELEKNSDMLTLATKYQDISEAQRLRRISAILSIEGGGILQNDVDKLGLLNERGVRVVTIRHSSRHDRDKEDRLTDFDIEAIAQMAKLGMLVDVSHCNDKIFYQVMDLVEDPPIASHSNCRALCDEQRNLTDNQIKTLADKGGVVGITFVPWMINEKQPTLDGVLDHIDHAVRLVGSEYVGLGSDFDGITSTPLGLEDVTKLPNITQGLVSRGYSDRDIENILGANYLRVFRKVLG